MPRNMPLPRRVRRLTVLLAATALTLAGCTDDLERSASPDASTAGSESPTAPGMTTEVQGNGATITIDAAYESDTIEMYSSDSWNDAEGRPVGNVEAREDGKYVVVETTVVNDTSSDMDLTCRSTGGWVEATLQVKDGSVYQPIQELYEIPDNPECNSNLGPGFDTEMTWAFLVPDDREPSTFSFKSDSAPNDEAPTAIRLDKIGEKPEVDDSAPAPTPGNAEDGTPAVPTA